ncbi:hypothetical protein CMEL01_16752 [Colletotrichum melonis]|uniref:Uncharacterized protein n=1 Tax=Colletotrichum melonis TaxID=1209925 RepID=A0AAI9UAP0_9PEZI|nr:hypothetical protein CMEL01_16752 [Colletotrichum melonis]
MPTVQNAPPGQVKDGIRFHLLPAKFDTGPADRAGAADQSVEAQEAAKKLDKLIGLLGVHIIVCRDDAELERIQSLLVDKSFSLQDNKGMEQHVWYMNRDTRCSRTDDKLRIAEFDHGKDTKALRTRLETISRGNNVFRVAAANPIKDRQVVVFIPFNELSKIGWLPTGWMECAACDGAGDGYEKVRKLMNGDE